MQTGQSWGQKTPGGRPCGQSERVRVRGLMVRTMRASGLSDELVAAILLKEEQLNGRVRQLLDYAEESLARPARDRPARQVQAYAQRKMQKAGAAAVARGLDPEDDPATLRATIEWLKAHAAVLRAEPDAHEHRAFLPEHIRDDPVSAIAEDIGTVERQIAELDARHEQARERERASARSRLNRMQTSDYARLSSAERDEWERGLGLDLPAADRPPATDALGRLHVPLDEERASPP
jgi:hypothetical protein